MTRFTEWYVEYRWCPSPSQFARAFRLEYQRNLSRAQEIADPGRRPKSAGILQIRIFVKYVIFKKKMSKHNLY
jgi:hypothetical protein